MFDFVATLTCRDYENTQFDLKNFIRDFDQFVGIMINGHLAGKFQKGFQFLVGILIGFFSQIYRDFEISVGILIGLF